MLSGDNDVIEVIIFLTSFLVRTNCLKSIIFLHYHSRRYIHYSNENNKYMGNKFRSTCFMYTVTFQSMPYIMEQVRIKMYIL